MTKTKRTCHNETLICPICELQYSACNGDYWQVPDKYEFLCEKCQSPLWLIKKGYSVFDKVKIIKKPARKKDLADII